MGTLANSVANSLGGEICWLFVAAQAPRHLGCPRGRGHWQLETQPCGTSMLVRAGTVTAISQASSQALDDAAEATAEAISTAVSAVCVCKEIICLWSMLTSAQHHQGRVQDPDHHSLIPNCNGPLHAGVWRSQCAGPSNSACSSSESQPTSVPVCRLCKVLLACVGFFCIPLLVPKP